MTQEISYRITFNFPSDEENRERLLSAIDLFLRALEEADRIMASSLGFVLQYRRSLREMGEEQFSYELTLTLRRPPQMVLGSWPEPSALREWMSRGRENLYISLLRSNLDAADDVVQRWHRRAVELTLADSLVYSPTSSACLTPVLEDLSRALKALGGPESVTFS